MKTVPQRTSTTGSGTSEPQQAGEFRFHDPVVVSPTGQMTRISEARSICSQTSKLNWRQKKTTTPSASKTSVVSRPTSTSDRPTTPLREVNEEESLRPGKFVTTAYSPGIQEIPMEVNVNAHHRRPVPFDDKVSVVVGDFTDGTKDRLPLEESTMPFSAAPTEMPMHVKVEEVAAAALHSRDGGSGSVQSTLPVELDTVGAMQLQTNYSYRTSGSSMDTNERELIERFAAEDAKLKEARVAPEAPEAPEAKFTDDMARELGTEEKSSHWASRLTGATKPPSLTEIEKQQPQSQAASTKTSRQLRSSYGDHLSAPGRPSADQSLKQSLHQPSPSVRSSEYDVGDGVSPKETGLTPRNTSMRKKRVDVESSASGDGRIGPTNNSRRTTQETEKDAASTEEQTTSSDESGPVRVRDYMMNRKKDDEPQENENAACKCAGGGGAGKLAKDKKLDIIPKRRPRDSCDLRPFDPAIDCGDSNWEWYRDANWGCDVFYPLKDCFDDAECPSWLEWFLCADSDQCQDFDAGWEYTTAPIEPNFHLKTVYRQGGHNISEVRFLRVDKLSKQQFVVKWEHPSGPHPLYVVVVYPPVMEGRSKPRGPDCGRCADDDGCFCGTEPIFRKHVPGVVKRCKIPAFMMELEQSYIIEVAAVSKCRDMSFGNSLIMVETWEDCPHAYTGYTGAEPCVGAF